MAWFGVAAPAGTPAAVVRRIADTIRSALADPALRQRIVAIGLQPAFLEPKAFGSHIGAQYAKYARVLDEAKIRTE